MDEHGMDELNMGEPIKFWKIADNYGFFSNFSAHPIMIDSMIYSTTEHYYQAMKSLDYKIRLDIRSAESPRKAASIGRGTSFVLRPDWELIKDAVMLEAVSEKVRQHPAIRQALVETGSREIIEANPHDSYWGSGEDGLGRNQLGRTWMMARYLIFRGRL